MGYLLCILIGMIIGIWIGIVRVSESWTKQTMDKYFITKKQADIMVTNYMNKYK